MPTPDFVSRKREIQRGLVRSNTATGVVLVVTLLLAVAAVFYALTAEKHAEAARVATRQTRAELWKAQLAQATAWRLSSRAGRRSRGLEAIANAARLRPSLELRNEALSTLPLIDTQPGPPGLALRETDIACAFAPGRGLRAWGDPRGRVTVGRLEGTNAVATVVLPGRIMALVFSPDERWLAAYSHRGGLFAGDPLAERPALRLSLPAGEFNQHALSFHPDSSLLAVCAPQEQVRFIRLDSGVELPPLAPGGPPGAAVFDAAGERLAVVSGDRIRIFDFGTRALVQTIELPAYALDLAWHPEGRHLAAACSDGKILLVAANGQATFALRGHTGLATRVIFDPTGAVLVSTAWDGTTRFWGASSGWPLLVEDSGYARQFDSSGRRLFHHKEGTGLGEWHFVPPIGLETLSTPVDGPRTVHALDFSPDGACLAGVTSGGVCLWDSHAGRLDATLAIPGALGVAIAANGQAVLVAGRAGLQQTAIERTDEGRLMFGGSLQPVEGWDGAALSWGFVVHGPSDRFVSGDGARIVVADLAPGGSVRTLDVPGAFTSLALSPDGRWLVTSFWKGNGTRVWNVETGQLDRRLEDEGGMAAFSPDGSRLAVGTAREFVLYDTSDWTRARRIERDAASALSGLVAFSPNGEFLALTLALRQVRLISASDWEELATLEGPVPDRINALSFSPDSRRLAAATDNGAVQVWDLPVLRQELAALSLDWAGEQQPATAPSSVAAVAGRTGFPDEASGVETWTRRRSLRTGALWLSGTGAALGVLLGLYSLRHQRRLVAAYGTLDALAQRRRQALESAQAQLVHSQKMTALGTLAAGVAHDFNNLLSIIRMAGQLVRRQLRPTGGALENLDAIEQAVEQGKSIAHSILGYSRRPGDPNQLYRVSEVMSETLSMLNKQYLSGIVLTLEQDPEAPSVRGDKNRFEQVLLNLIVNAVEAMQAHGKLTLRVRGRTQGSTGGVLPARPAGRYVEVTVSDTGAGIAPELRTRIFEPFFTTKQSGGEHGTGLGLTTVYTIARDEGWGLDLDTEPGRGTTFCVLVPAADGAPVEPGGRDLPIPPGADAAQTGREVP